VKPTHRRRRRALIALLAALVGAGLGGQLIASSAHADPPTGQNAAPCIPSAGYPNTPDTRKVANLTEQEKADLKKDILESIIQKETNGVATESTMKTSSGYKASYKSLVQTTAPTAITTLLRLPANQLAGFKPNVGDKQPLTQAQLKSAQTVSDAAVFLWKGMRALEQPNENAQAAARKAGTKVPADLTAADVLKGTYQGHKNETSRTTAGLTVDNVTTMLDFYRSWVPTKKFPKPPLEDGYGWARAAISTNSATKATAEKIQDIVTSPDADGRAGLALGRTVVDNAFNDVLKSKDAKTMTVDQFVEKVGVKHNGSGKAAAAYGKDLVKIYHQKMQARQNNATKPCPKSKAPTPKPKKPTSPPKPQPQPTTPQGPAPLPLPVPAPVPTTSPTLPDGAGTPCIPAIEKCPPVPPVQLPDLPSPPAPVIPAPAGPPGGPIPGVPSFPDLPDPAPPPPPDGDGTPCFPEIEDCPGYSDYPQLGDPWPDTGYDPGYDGGYGDGGGGGGGGGGYGGGCDYYAFSECFEDEAMKVA
jgi:hypothetical protein